MAERKDIMLAHNLTQARFDKMPKPVIVQPKLNGNRCRSLFSNEKEVNLFSSSAAEIVSMPHIVKELKTLSLWGIELDGELYRHGWRHQKINGIVRRTVSFDSEHEQLSYCIYDIIDESISQLNRHNGLRQVDSFIKARGLTKVYVLKSYFAERMEQVMFWLAKFVDEGYEGIIIRDPTKPYVRKRTDALLKLKPSKFSSYKIIGYKRGLSEVCIVCRNTPSRCTCVGTKPELVSVPLETLGAIKCKTPEGKEFYVGTGEALTDLTRADFWQHRSELVGKYALVKYHELSVDGAPVPGMLVEISMQIRREDER